MLSEGGCPIAASTYYAAKSRPTCDRVVRDAKLVAQIRRVHADNYRVYGARKVWRQPHREGIQVARCTVERLMTADGLHRVIRGAKIKTTKPDAAVPRPGDLVERQFSAQRRVLPDDHRLAGNEIDDHRFSPGRFGDGDLAAPARRP